MNYKGAMMVGSTPVSEDRCQFKVWAPLHQKMTLHIVHPAEKKIAMQKDTFGYFTATVADAKEGTQYFYIPNDEKGYPDPASHYQPQGVHGPSAVVNHDDFTWGDAAWRGIPMQDLILYELHVGTFTPEGTFEAIIPRLDDLVELGINALELMPVAQFPGDRNWGYDGTYPYAVQNSYGGPHGLKKLVDACHQKGIAVFLDVVYNHLGPEGNYISHFGPYFTNTYCTPWGDALNFDGDWSDGVRTYFSDNALHWFQNYHIDGLRLDAIHMVYDNGAVHFWELLHQKVKALEQTLGRVLHLTAESDLNSPRVIRSPELGGYGFDAQWLDDFHHALYVLLDKKGKERYEDFGRIEQLAKAYTDGFVHSGEYVKFRKRKHGASSAGVPGNKFIIFNHNHDQVGNRVKGERLCMLVDFERVKIAAAAILLAPYVPLIFMGEEYADESPFFYFVSHSDPALIKAVKEGRKKEFESYNKDAEPPDPQDTQTFESSKLQWHKRAEGKHNILLAWHKHLIQLRKHHPILQQFDKNCVRVNIIHSEAFVLVRSSSNGLQQLLGIFNLSETEISYTLPVGVPHWKLLLNSKAHPWLHHQDEQAYALPQQAAAGNLLSVPPLSVLVWEGNELLHEK